MQTLVLGISQQSGVGKESGKPYSIAPKLIIASPMAPVSSERLNIRCVGFESVGVDCTPEVFQQLQQYPSGKFPMSLDLETTLTRRGEQAVSLVVGVKARQAA